MKRWRGFCAACRKDLYTDPLRHYTSDSHRLAVERANKREDLAAKGAKEQ